MNEIFNAVLTMGFSIMILVMTLACVLIFVFLLDDLWLDSAISKKLKKMLE